jgi:hypothetical protein
MLKILFFKNAIKLLSLIALCIQLKQIFNKIFFNYLEFISLICFKCILNLNVLLNYVTNKPNNEYKLITLN